MKEVTPRTIERHRSLTCQLKDRNMQILQMTSVLAVGS